MFPGVVKYATKNLWTCGGHQQILPNETSGNVNTSHISYRKCCIHHLPLHSLFFVRNIYLTISEHIIYKRNAVGHHTTVIIHDEFPNPLQLQSKEIESLHPIFL
jgi:hypothetical protein